MRPAIEALLQYPRIAKHAAYIHLFSKPRHNTRKRAVRGQTARDEFPSGTQSGMPVADPGDPDMLMRT
jgi:hypothetical protein